eukprot:EC787136.1.p1 GENE.EC787136.1~~EC787136.1.p1  ORF type:complete len:127 (+),score=36.32 EC787136.1:36-416(+)
MSNTATGVSLRGYFVAAAGNVEALKALADEAVSIVRAAGAESGCRKFGYSMSPGALGSVTFAFIDEHDSAESVLANLARVHGPLSSTVNVAALTRFEVIGPKAELDKLRAAPEVLALQPIFFELQE